MEIEVKYQACNLCNALCRNINDNFKSVSFEIFNNGDIHIKIILEKRTEIEDEYINDMSAEFEASQQTNFVTTIEVEVKTDSPPLQNIVYQK
jgi:hypothetical protein